MADITIDVDTRQIDAFLADVERDLELAYNKAAEDTAAEATTNTERVLTGAMRGAWRAVALGALDWLVGSFGVAYTIYHEFGTRYLSPSPMLTPAFDHQKRLLLRAIKALGKKWTRKFGGGK